MSDLYLLQMCSSRVSIVYHCRSSENIIGWFKRKLFWLKKNLTSLLQCGSQCQWICPIFEICSKEYKMISQSKFYLMAMSWLCGEIDIKYPNATKCARELLLPFPFSYFDKCGLSAICVLLLIKIQSCKMQLILC